MKKLLLASALLLSTPVLASAGTIAESNWDFFVTSASAAYACNLVTRSELSDAMDEMYVIGFPDHLMPDAYAADIPGYAQEGRDDAAAPGFCKNFDPNLLDDIRHLASGYAVL